MLPADAALELHAVRAKELTKKAAKIAVEGLAIVCLPSTGLPLPFAYSHFMQVRLAIGRPSDRDRQLARLRRWERLVRFALPGTAFPGTSLSTEALTSRRCLASPCRDMFTDPRARFRVASASRIGHCHVEGPVRLHT